MTVIPPCKWAQLKDRLLFTVEVFDAKDVAVTFESQKLVFKATGTTSGKQGEFAHTVNLFKEITSEGSTYKVIAREIQVSVMKKEKGFWDRLTAEPAKTTKNWLSCDWSRWKEEDEDDERANVGDFGGYGDMGGMDMGGMGGDSDDDEPPPDMDDLDKKETEAAAGGSPKKEPATSPKAKTEAKPAAATTDAGAPAAEAEAAKPAAQ